MTAAEIFSKINSTQLTGVMFHNDMISYFEFLSLKGFSMIQKYQYFSENVEMQNVSNYFMRHYNTFIPNSDVKQLNVIPNDWKNYVRFDVDKNTREKSVKRAFDEWRKWEHNAKKVYEKAYVDLISIEEISAANFVLDLVMDVNGEIARIEDMILELQSVSYDSVAIRDMQHPLFEEYREKVNDSGKKIL